MSRADRLIGIALGVVVGVAIVVIFVLTGGTEGIDAPSLENGRSGTGSERTQPVEGPGTRSP